MSRKSQDNLSTQKTGWEMAVEDAKKIVRNAEVKLAEAGAVLAICVDRQTKGEPFPAEAFNEETNAQSDVAA